VAAILESGAELGDLAVAGIGDDHRRLKTPLVELVEHVEREPPLRPVLDLLGDPRARAPLVIFVPLGRHKQPPVQRARGPV
jgi:hypothetical protein